MNDSALKSKLFHAMRLKCPYCGKTALLRKGSWFRFDQGCRRCDYRFERESGYWTGASWMINYGLSAFITILLSIYLVIAWQEVDPLVIAALACAFALVFAMLFFPFAKALWLWADHCFHPRGHLDSFDDHNF